MTPYRIFVVEDDEAISSLLVRELGAWGFDAKRVCDFRCVAAEFADFSPQLVLLDISLPFKNGFSLCGEIRKVSKVPIIFISSASDNMNIVMAMNMGGDDFIAKPFDLNVLIAKVRAVLRRTYDFTDNSSLIEHNGAILNIADGTLTFGEEKLELTKNDLRILQALLENRGRVVSRDSLMERLWETDNFVDENTLTVNVARLRKKLSDIGLDGYIETKKGMGYIIP